MTQLRRTLTEKEIRNAVVRRLLGTSRADELLIEELGVGSARVDLALANDRLLGFEIKSDFDTLDRLARQMHAYHCVFDTLTIVTTETYLSQVEALLPAWWGIWVAESKENATVEVSERRAATTHDRRDPNSLAAMLWRDEAYAFVVDTLGPVVRARASRGDLQEVIAGQIPLDQIRERVLRSLRGREDLRVRSHVAGDVISDCQDDVMTGGIPPPGHVAA